MLEVVIRIQRAEVLEGEIGETFLKVIEPFKVQVDVDRTSYALQDLCGRDT